jgi:hypothetical protein
MGPAFAGTSWDRVSASIKSVKMMHRSMAMTDAETIGLRYRSADPGLGVPHGGFHVLALCKACYDGGGQ